MRFSNFTKKGLALVLSLSMVVGVTATAPKTADAAKKSAKVPVSLMYCGENGNGYRMQRFLLQMVKEAKKLTMWQQLKMALLLLQAKRFM